MVKINYIFDRITLINPPSFFHCWWRVLYRVSLRLYTFTFYFSSGANFQTFFVKICVDMMSNQKVLGLFFFINLLKNIATFSTVFTSKYFPCLVTHFSQRHLHAGIFVLPPTILVLSPLWYQIFGPWRGTWAWGITKVGKCQIKLLRRLKRNCHIFCMYKSTQIISVHLTKAMSTSKFNSLPWSIFTQAIFVSD